MEVGGRIIQDSTPKFSKMVSSKYSDLGSRKVQKDLRDNHGRRVSRSYIQDVSQAVGQISSQKEAHWQYALPRQVVEEAKIVSIGRDGTTMYLTGDGYRETMSGTLSFYNEQAERIHTIYVAQHPEYGKATFDKRFQSEIDRLKKALPDVTYLGVADGATDNWTFLEDQVHAAILDFYHATTYLTQASDAASKSRYERKKWLEKARHRLKNESGAAQALLTEMKGFRRKRISKVVREKLQGAITYFENHHQQMDYAQFQQLGYPIGSGVTEAACKVIVKERLCLSGMMWKEQGAQIVLNIRCLHHTEGRWQQFWDFVDRWGVAA